MTPSWPREPAYLARNWSRKGERLHPIYGIVILIA
jgi:hypothetical protein